MDKTPTLLFSRRFFVTVIIFLGFINNGIIMYNLNIALVEMTSNRSIVLGNQIIVRPAEFQWDSSDIGMISSITNFGGLFSLAGTPIVHRLGGAVSFAFFSMLRGILTIILPASLYANFLLFVVIRLLTGFSTFCCYSSTSEIYSRWFPKRERSTLINFCNNGFIIGTAITNPLFGIIADQLGWQMVFYISGSISLIVSLLIYIFIKNQPKQDVRISEQELAYILDGTRETSQKNISHRSHPYKEILLSYPVWALCAVNFIVIWMTNMTNSCLALYAKDLTGRRTGEVGLVSGTPMALSIILYPLFGTFMDYWRNHSHISRTQIDKIAIGSSFLSISVLLAACALFSNLTITVILFTLMMTLLSAAPTIFEPNIVNIAPNDSSVVYALTNICSCLGTVVARTLTGYLTMNHTSQEWNNSFLVSSGMVIASGAIYLKFGSSEAQSWSLWSNTEDECDYLIKDKNENK